ncbi:MAG: GNAT family N-acetyltransferase [Flavipsychrobacter sp.]
MVEIVRIQPEHNQSLYNIIRNSLLEFDIDLNGTVYVDPYLDNMHGHFNVPHKVYYVAVEDGKVLGGSGIAPLDDTNTEVCELQRMFLTKEARGKGVGKQLMETCLKEAKKRGFKQCYLETFEEMQQAIKLYERTGFRHIDHAMGNTGHFACQTRMVIDL